jgi:hypothetical protein
MNSRRAFPTIALLIPLMLLTQAYACTGSVVHKVTVAQHDFRISVQAFQDTEIALYNQGGVISPDTHREIQEYIGKVAQAGVDLDTALASNAPTSTLKTKLDSIMALLDQLNTQGLLGVKSQNAKLALTSALLAIKGIVAGAEAWVTQ